MSLLEKIEKKAFHEYFRLYGSDAEQPSHDCTEFPDRNGEHYVRLGNIDGPLATFKIALMRHNWFSLEPTD